jgi:hypothetical protein
MIHIYLKRIKKKKELIKEFVEKKKKKIHNLIRIYLGKMKPNLIKIC